VTGKIITFYSYKGGSGRSLALANVAWILASRGKRVLCVDWDLEAPGLHRYFGPFLNDPQLAHSRGVIDWLYQYLQAATSEGAAASASQPWFAGYADVSRYAQPVQWSFAAGGEIDFVGAGQQNAGYALRVGSFDWDRLYTDFGGSAFFEHGAARLRGEYDYILIDSRTGISDTAGICTIQLPDALALLFTLNNQSIEGAAAVTAEILRARGADSARPLRVYPCATRIELAEKQKLERRRRLVEERFLPLIAASQTALPSDYLAQMEVLYDPYYAYDEVLATLADQPGRSNSVLAALERLTQHLSEGAVDKAAPMSDALRAEALGRYEPADPARRSSAPQLTAAAPRYDVVILASSADDTIARTLHRALASSSRPFYAGIDVAAGAPWEARVEQVIADARLVLFLVSRAGDAPRLLGEPQHPELARRLLRVAQEQQVRVAPLYFGGARQGILATRFPELAALQGFVASAEDQLPRVCREVDVLLGVPQLDRTSDEAGLEVWRERLVYTTHVADQRERTITVLRRWFMITAGALTCATVLSFWYYLGANQSALGLTKRLAAVQSQLTAAESAARTTNQQLAARDQAELQALRDELAPVQDAMQKAGVTTASLSAHLNDLASGAKSARAELDQANSQLALSSSVLQELGVKIAGLRADVESATLSDAPKQQLRSELQALSDQHAAQLAALAHAAARMNELAAEQGPRSRS
jgi:hypothetical protein